MPEKHEQVRSRSRVHVIDFPRRVQRVFADVYMEYAYAGEVR